MTAEPLRYAAPVELSPVLSPDASSPDAERGALNGLDGIPTDPPVGLIDASADSSTQRSQVVVDAACDLALDELVVTAQRLADRTALFHYGVVVEVTAVRPLGPVVDRRPAVPARPAPP